MCVHVNTVADVQCLRTDLESPSVDKGASDCAHGQVAQTGSAQFALPSSVITYVQAHACAHVCVCVCLCAQVKERAILKGKWPGRAGPKGKGDEEAEYEQYKEEVRVRDTCTHVPTFLSERACVLWRSSLSQVHALPSGREARHTLLSIYQQHT